MGFQEEGAIRLALTGAHDAFLDNKATEARLLLLVLIFCFLAFLTEAIL